MTGGPENGRPRRAWMLPVIIAVAVAVLAFAVIVSVLNGTFI